MGWINPAQFERDHAGQRNICAADGHEGSERNPLVLDDEGYRVHASHFAEPDTRFKRQQDADQSPTQPASRQPCVVRNDTDEEIDEP